MGLVKRVDRIGSLLPKDLPQPPVAALPGAGAEGEGPPGDPQVHVLFGNILLLLVYVLNRFKLHTDKSFMERLLQRSKVTTPDANSLPCL